MREMSTWHSLATACAPRPSMIPSDRVLIIYSLNVVKKKDILRRNMQELVGLLVVLVVWVCVACESAPIRAILCFTALALFVGISSHSTRASFVSARKAAADRLPQTSNPRYKGSASNNSASVPENHAETGELPQTTNPRRKAAETTSAPRSEKGPDLPRGSINDVAYTFEGQRAKLDARIFRPEPQRQSSEARARMLDALYQELVDTSQKSDPAMRQIGGDGCEMMRGRAAPRPV